MSQPDHCKWHHSVELSVRRGSIYTAFVVIVAMTLNLLFILTTDDATFNMQAKAFVLRALSNPSFKAFT
jgi:hypothetical protein